MQFHQGSMWCDSNDRHAYEGSTTLVLAAEHVAFSLHFRRPTVTIHLRIEELGKPVAWRQADTAEDEVPLM